MQQIADWVEKLGMSSSPARLFAENRIDFSVLPEQYVFMWSCTSLILRIAHGRRDAGCRFVARWRFSQCGCTIAL